jgi:hypothetical protein
MDLLHDAILLYSAECLEVEIAAAAAVVVAVDLVAALCLGALAQ